MDVLSLLIGKILPYVTLAALVLGLIYRIRRWHKAAVANMALYPAASKSKGEMWRKVLGEVFFFTTFRKENKGLWWSSWVFHVTLAVIVLGHTRLITDWPLRVMFGMSAASVDTLSAWAGGIAGIVVMLCCLILVLRRVLIRRVREISNSGDYLVALLFLAIFASGNYMRFFSHFEMAEAQTYFASLFSSQAIAVPQSPAFLLHSLLVQVLLIYLPLGKLLHIPGIFYSKPLLAKDY